MSFSRYPKYKPSGVEWLGDVPVGWGASRIKWLGKTVTGGTPKTEDPAYWQDGDVPWLPSGKVQNNTINKQDADTFITKRALAESAAKLIRPGSALIALTGATCANAAYLTFESTANQSVVGIEPKSNSHGRFIYFSLLSQREQILTHKSGGAQGGINQEDVRNLVITAPPPAEQTAIAEFLDLETGKIDELVAEQRRLMELLKEKRQAIISHAVTKGLNPHAPMQPSGIEWLGDVPVGWRCAPLKYLARVQTGYAFSSEDFVGEGVPVLRIGDITPEGAIDFTGARYLPCKYQSEHPDVVVVRGDIVMAMTGATIGKAGWYASDQPALLNQRVCIFRAMEPNSQRYLWHILGAHFYSEHIVLTAFGGAQPNISDAQLLQLVVPLPPKSEQLAIADFLDTELAKFDTLTAEAEKAIGLLQERRTALISAAVTGQIDVRQQPNN